jgi:hypothetical protein
MIFYLSFLIDVFFFFILQHWFWFAFYKVISISSSKSWIWQVNPVWPWSFQYVFISIFLKNISSCIVFSQTIFLMFFWVIFRPVKLTSLHWVNPTRFKFFSTRKHVSNTYFFMGLSWSHYPGCSNIFLKTCRLELFLVKLCF